MTDCRAQRQFRHARATLFGCILLAGAASAADAQDAASLPATPDQPANDTATTPEPPGASALKGDLMTRGALLGDPWGIRSTLIAHGVSIGLTETSEGLGNATGGVQRGAIYEGLAAATLGIDTGKLLGLDGGTISISAYQVHGRGLSANTLDNLSTVSSIEADRSLRLFEAWYEQSLFNGKAAIRIGQQAADQEFLISQYGTLFINSQFGWPTLPGVDLPSGANAYPLGTPGVRLKLQPTDALTALVAVYNGDPAGKGTGDPQIRDAGGTGFDLDDGVFVIGELQLAIDQGKDQHGLPGTYKIGTYYNSNAFGDQETDNQGRSLADPDSDGNALLHRRDWGIYAVMDQLLWQHGNGADKGIGLFGRIVGTRGDRNLVSLYVEGGLSWKGVLPSRPDDSLGMAVGYTQISGRARQLDRDTAFFSGEAYPVRDAETVIELTYQAPVTPWLSLQPDAQYVIHPGGGLPDPDDAGRRIGDEAVFGLRATIAF
ncbi:MAG: carbohydrate porin [Janthinobacterium lividum]